MKRKQKKEIVKQEQKQEDIVEMLKPFTNSLKRIDSGYWVLAGIILVVALLVGYGLYHAKTSNNFTYNGVDFERNYFGKILLYTAKVPALDTSGKVVSTVDVDFRNNPRSLANIPVLTGGINFLKGTVYISYQNNISICENNMLAAVNLQTFMKTFRLSTLGALDDKQAALKANLTYATCANNPDNTVVMIKDGNKTAITQTGRNCYELTSNNCEILSATEKFELQILEQYMANFKKA